MESFLQASPVGVAHCLAGEALGMIGQAMHIGAMHTGSLTVWQLTVLVWIGSAIAGLLGSLTGLGGGVVLVPPSTPLFKVVIRYAIGSSLVSFIPTCPWAAAHHVN